MSEIVYVPDLATIDTKRETREVLEELRGTWTDLRCCLMCCLIELQVWRVDTLLVHGEDAVIGVHGLAAINCHQWQESKTVPRNTARGIAHPLTPRVGAKKVC